MPPRPVEPNSLQLATAHIPMFQMLVWMQPDANPMAGAIGSQEVVRADSHYPNHLEDRTDTRLLCPPFCFRIRRQGL